MTALDPPDKPVEVESVSITDITFSYKPVSERDFLKDAIRVSVNGEPRWTMTMRELGDAIGDLAIFLSDVRDMEGREM